MSDSPPIRSRFEIYCKILYHGLVEIRDAGWSNKPEICAAQADHLHNLPDLLNNFEDEELHDFYWNCMRNGIRKEIPGRSPWPQSEFEALWKELELATRKERQED